MGKTDRREWGFTKQEIVAIIFLASAFALGIAIRWLAPRALPPIGEEPGLFAASDSEFAARSRALLADPPTHSPPSSRNAPRHDPAPRSIDLNTATATELVSLPGIGEATAKKIITYREENGPFGQLEDLMEVDGIGPKKFAKIEPFLRTP